MIWIIGQKAGAPPPFRHSSPNDPQAPASSPRRKLVGQARFSDARLARNHEHPPMAGNRLVQRAAELSEFALASNEPFAGFIMLAFRMPEELSTIVGFLPQPNCRP